MTDVLNPVDIENGIRSCSDRIAFPLAAVWDGDLLTVPADPDEPTPDDLRPVLLDDDGYDRGGDQ